VSSVRRLWAKNSQIVEVSVSRGSDVHAWVRRSFTKSDNYFSTKTMRVHQIAVSGALVKVKKNSGMEIDKKKEIHPQFDSSSAVTGAPSQAAEGHLAEAWRAVEVNLRWGVRFLHSSL
jgi:hypothetical protein